MLFIDGSELEENSTGERKNQTPITSHLIISVAIKLLGWKKGNDNITFHILRCHQVAEMEKKATITSHFIFSVAIKMLGWKKGKKNMTFHILRCRQVAGGKKQATI
ncbi:MAG: hypothetical protein K5686_09830 [Lachnospiraceae bacterium]|nr:hypothetical protein [Lachnospiraceae bacterium]